MFRNGAQNRCRPAPDPRLPAGNRGTFPWNDHCWLWVGRRAFEVGIGQIVQRHREVQAQQIIHPIEQGVLDDVPVLHYRIRSAIQRHQWHGLKIDVQQFTQAALLGPANGM